MAKTKMTKTKCWNDDVDAIAAAMKRQGVNQIQLAKVSGISQQAVSNILSKKIGMSVRTAKKLRTALGLAIVDTNTIRPPEQGSEWNVV